MLGGFGCGRSHRSRSRCHRSRVGPSHPPVRRRDPLRGRRLSSPSWPRCRRWAACTVPVTCPAVINRSAPAAARVRRFQGAKRGTNLGRRQATPGDSQPWLVQLNISNSWGRAEPRLLAWGSACGFSRGAVTGVTKGSVVRYRRRSAPVRSWVPGWAVPAAIARRQCGLNLRRQRGSAADHRYCGQRDCPMAAGKSVAVEAPRRAP